MLMVTENMQVIQIVSSISASEYVHFLVIAVSSMHVAGTRWNSSHLDIEPPEASQVEDMHIVSGQWSLSQPSSNYVESAI